MKLKHINVIERYFERALLLLAAGFFGAVIWFYFLGGPYNVKVSPDNPHGAPDEVEEYLATRASTLKMLIKSPTPKFTLTSVLPYTEDFRRRYTRHVIDVSSFDLPLGQPGLDPTQFTYVELPPPNYDVPVLPVPTTVKTRSDHYVLGDVPDTQTSKAYDTLIGTQQPRDFRAVTVWAGYDMKKLEDLYANAPEAQRIPANLWRNCLYFTDVKLERQTLDPATDQWGEDTIIDYLPVPGRDDFRNIPPDIAPSEANQKKESVRLEQDQIARPDFAPTTPDRPWAPPGESGNTQGGSSVLRVWAHDLSVQPGTTYRYRLSVSLLDPLYRVAKLNPAQHDAYYNSFSLPPSNPSAWSSPVTIDQARYFYLVGASRSRGNAKVEVWYIFNGVWNHSEFDVWPGDMIGKSVKKAVGATTYNVNLRLNAMAVDIDFDAPPIKAGETNNVGLIVLNNVSGKIFTKTVEEDADDLKRSQLRAESGQGAAAAKP